jgi:hypothetical protein
MGLDRDDAVIRRRMRQKVEFISDLAAGEEPTEAELKLLFFNLGVEICQILFVAVVLALFTILQRISMAFVGGTANRLQAWLRLAGAYGIRRIAHSG